MPAKTIGYSQFINYLINTIYLLYFSYSDVFFVAYFGARYQMIPLEEIKLVLRGQCYTLIGEKDHGKQ